MPSFAAPPLAGGFTQKKKVSSLALRASASGNSQENSASLAVPAPAMVIPKKTVFSLVVLALASGNSQENSAFFSCTSTC